MGLHQPFHPPRSLGYPWRGSFLPPMKCVVLARQLLACIFAFCLLFPFPWRCPCSRRETRPAVGWQQVLKVPSAGEKAEPKKCGPCASESTIFTNLGYLKQYLKSYKKRPKITSRINTKSFENCVRKPSKNTSEKHTQNHKQMPKMVPRREGRKS